MSDSDLYTVWFWEIQDPQPEKTYACDGPGVVQMVNNTTEFACTLWENADGTGKKHVIPRQTEIDELSFSPKSLTFAPDSPEGHPKLTDGDRMFNFFRELPVEPPGSGKDAEKVHKIDGVFELDRAWNRTPDLWMTLWGNDDCTGDKLIVEPGGGYSGDEIKVSHFKAIAVSRTRPQGAPEPYLVQSGGKATGEAPRISLTWNYTVKDPQEGKTYSAEGPGTVTFVNNDTSLYVTFWEKEDAAGEKYFVAPSSSDDSLALKTRSLTFSTDGPRMSGPQDREHKKPELHYFRELGFDQPKDGRVYTFDAKGGKLDELKNYSDDWWITVWENADCTGKKQILHPSGLAQREDKNVKLTHARALTVHREKPK